MAGERRNFQRFVLHQMIEISFRKEQFLQVETLDVSEVGMKCHADFPVSLANKLFVMFEIPETATTRLIKTDAVVAWTQPKDEQGKYVFGLHFISLDDDDRRILRTYLQQV